jgi:hypothetical protein
MADRYPDDRDTNYFRESYGAQDTNRKRDDRGEYGEQGTRASGYDEPSDVRLGYTGYQGRDYADRYSERGGRTVQGSGGQGRNWAERAGDEVKSWVGDNEAERRREHNAQKMGRYPGEDRGHGRYGRHGRYGANDRPGSSNLYNDGYGTRGSGGSSNYGSGGGYNGGSLAGRDYGYADGGRTVEGSGAGGRNWAERTGDEVKSWVGDDEAERRRQQDRQQSGRYPGEQPGERRFGENYGSNSYGRGDYGSTNYSQNQGYGGRTSPTVNYRDADQRSQNSASGYGARASSYTPSSYTAYDDSRESTRTTGAEVNPNDRGFMMKAADEVKSWFGDDEAERRRQMDAAREDAAQAFGGSSSAGYGYTGATSASSGSMNAPHDPHYVAYRQARIAEYDRDYNEYRQTKAKEFHDDFHSFRTNKGSATGTSGASAVAVGTGAALGAASYGAAASGLASQLKEHMVVDGSDGQGIGKIDHLTATDIKLTKHDSTDNKHHLVPISWVASVEGNKVKLSKTSDQAMREWRVADDTAKT